MKQLFAILIFVSVLLQGCAVTNATLDLPLPPSPETPAPAIGKQVTIVGIRDCRPFQANPVTANIPSVPEDQSFQQTAPYAIGRKRNSYGMSLGVLTLPQHRPLTSLVSDLVAQAFREKGYTVVPYTPQTDLTQVIPVFVDIHQFYAWFQPGFWSVHANFESVLAIYSPAIQGPPANPFIGVASTGGNWISEKDWHKAYATGMEDLKDQIVARIAP